MALGLSGSFGARAAQQELVAINDRRIAEEQRRIHNQLAEQEMADRMAGTDLQRQGLDIQRQKLAFELQPREVAPVIQHGLVNDAGLKVMRGLHPITGATLFEQPEYVAPDKPEKPPNLTPEEAFLAATPDEQKRMLSGHRQWSDAGRAPSGEGQGIVPLADPNAPHGADYLKSLNPQTAAMVKSLAEGRQPWPSGFAMKTPYWQDLANKVFQYDPTFDTATASNNARVRVRTDFTSGTSAKQVNALNTVVGHLGTLRDQVDALGNTTFQPFNTVKNAVKTAFGSPDVTNFNTTKEAVASELVRVWRQAGGASQDVQDWKQSIDASQSPQQLSAALATIGQLLESKLEALQEQHRQGMGVSDIRMITPESRSALDRLEGNKSAGATVTVRAPNGQTKDVPASEADYWVSKGATVIKK